MILINRDPEDYIYDFDTTSALAFVGSTPLLAYISTAMFGTWGNAYGDIAAGYSTNHGWCLSFVNKTDHGIESHFSTLRIPQLSLTIITSGLGYVSPFIARLKFPQASLFTDCSNWTFTSSGLIFTIDSDVIYSTSAPITLTGIDFDPDHNANYGTGTAVPGFDIGTGPGCLSCSAPPPDGTTYEATLSGALVFGWQYNQGGSGYIAESCDLDTSYDPPTVACSGVSCLDSLIKPSNSGNLCSAITVPFSAHDLTTGTFYANLKCYCDGVELFQFPVWYFETTHEVKASKAWADPLSGTSRNTQEDSGAICWSSGGMPPFITQTQTLARTHAMDRWYASVTKVYENVYCSEASGSTPVCPDPIHEGDPAPVFTCDPIPACSSCEYDAYSLLSWINTSCQSIEAMPWIINENRGQYHRAVINSINQGDVVYRRSDHSVPLPSWASEQTVTSTGDCKFPKMLIDIVTRRIWLDYIRGSNLYSSYSDNDGSTFTSGAVIATGVTHSSLVHSIQGDSWRTYV